MLEVINGSLMIYFATLCALNILLPFLIKPIAACFSRPSNDERTAWAEVVRLKAEQKSVSMKDEFAVYSKLQRKINKLESEIREGSQTRMSKSIAIKSSAQIIVQVVLAIMTVLSVIWFRREPIVVLKTNLFPFSTMLSYPSELPNSISTHMWVLVSNVSMRSLLKPLTC